MDIEEARVIFKSISLHDRKGIKITQLSKETGISKLLLKKYLTERIDYFTKVGRSSKYTVNQFSIYKGSTDSMLMDLEKKKKRNQAVLFIFVGTAVYLYYLFSIWQ